MSATIHTLPGARQAPPMIERALLLGTISAELRRRHPYDMVTTALVAAIQHVMGGDVDEAREAIDEAQALRRMEGAGA